MSLVNQSIILPWNDRQRNRNPGKTAATNIQDAVDIQTLPVSDVTADGKVNEEEWKSAFLCAPFIEYRSIWMTGMAAYKVNYNKGETIPTRMRFCQDAENLNFLIDFQELSEADSAVIYIAPDFDSKPVMVTVNPHTKTVSSPVITSGIQSAFKDSKAEVKISKNTLGIKDQRAIYINAAREQDKSHTLWRGNPSTEKNVISFAQFVIKE